MSDQWSDDDAIFSALLEIDAAPIPNPKAPATEVDEDEVDQDILDLLYGDLEDIVNVGSSKASDLLNVVIEDVGPSQASAVLFEAEPAPSLEVVPVVIQLDEVDHVIMDCLAQSVLDMVFVSIAEDSGDGELLAVLHLMSQIAVAEQLAEEAELLAEAERLAEAEETDSAGYGELDYGDYFDCWA